MKSDAEMIGNALIYIVCIERIASLSLYIDGYVEELYDTYASRAHLLLLSLYSMYIFMI